MRFYEEYKYLKKHPAFAEHFNECLDIEVVLVSPASNRIEDDDTLNTKTRVWLECGPWKYFPLTSDYSSTHDTRLDCGGDSFEEAICKLAELVRKYYGYIG